MSLTGVFMIFKLHPSRNVISNHNTFLCTVTSARIIHNSHGARGRFALRLPDARTTGWTNGVGHQGPMDALAVKRMSTLKRHQRLHFQRIKANHTFCLIHSVSSLRRGQNFIEQSRRGIIHKRMHSRPLSPTDVLAVRVDNLIVVKRTWVSSPVVVEKPVEDHLNPILEKRDATGGAFFRLGKVDQCSALRCTPQHHLVRIIVAFRPSASI
mmetsp:Transcript_21697/g.49119  ORF Transcript_21697/g.49119 Transcript_21697/m.49119 type:complete len:211 (+) Transcript_21697:1111-1743(+)